MKKVVLVSYAGFAIVVIALLIYILATGNKRENYRKCICTESEGGRGRTCQDTTEVNNDYVSNKWTEFSQFPNKGWSNVSPGDVSWPESAGCNWPDYNDGAKQWFFWDYPQFGS